MGKKNRAAPAPATAPAPKVEPAARVESRNPDQAWLLLFGAWVIASVSTLGAIFVSEVMGHPPCVLCWYQRICMFPLAVILALGLFPFDARVIRYTLPLAAAGAVAALFHVLLLAGVIPEDMKPCTQGVPCTDVPIQFLGFLTLPLLSLIAFGAIVGLMIVARTKVPE